MTPRRKHVAGFTLIELMITVTVVGILATLALPAYSSFIEKRKITGGAEEIAAFLMLARGEAVKRNQPITVSFNRNDSTDWCIGMTLGDTACDCTSGPADDDYCALKYTEGGNDIVEPQLISSSNFSNFKLKAASTGSGVANALTFDPVRGILLDVDDASSFTIESDGGDYELETGVSATGTVKTCTSVSKSVPGFKYCAN